MSVHISLATDNVNAYEAVARALEVYRSLSKSAPPVLIDGAPVHREDFRNIGPIMVEAKRRADAIRVARRSTVGVGIAYGRARLMCARGAAKATFHFTAILATVADGALAFAVPNVYPDRLSADLVVGARTVFAKMRSTVGDHELIGMAGVSAGAWAGLDFGDPHVEYEELG